jgi:hypothetical protein
VVEVTLLMVYNGGIEIEDVFPGSAGIQSWKQSLIQNVALRAGNQFLRNRYFVRSVVVFNRSGKMSCGIGLQS